MGLPVKIWLNPSDPICARPHLPSAEEFDAMHGTYQASAHQTYERCSREKGTRAFFRAARVQNEIAPEKILNRYEKRFEKREKGSEKRSETRLKIF